MRYQEGQKVTYRGKSYTVTLAIPYKPNHHDWLLRRPAYNLYIILGENDQRRHVWQYELDSENNDGNAQDTLRTGI